MAKKSKKRKISTVEMMNAAQPKKNKKEKVQQDAIAMFTLEQDPILLEKRRQRFLEEQGSTEPNEPNITNSNNKKKKKKKKRKKILIEESNDEKAKAGVIKGTGKSLEKSYFRLTSEPSVCSIRSEETLSHALKMVKAKWQSGRQSYWHSLMC